MKKVFILAMAIISAAVSGCMPVKTAKVQGLLPAKYDGAAKLRRIAVMAFNGKEGDQIAALLENALASQKIENEPYFQVVGADQRTRGVDSTTSGISGVDLAKAVAYGRKLNVAGVYGGDVLYFNVDSQRYQEERTECVEYEKSSKFFKKCLQSRRYTVPCTKATAKTSVAVRLIEVASQPLPL